MRRFARKLRNWLPRSAASTSTARAARKRLQLEMLEDRCLLAGNASADLSGIAFIDINGNGMRDANEAAVPGVMVHLTGTTYLGASVDKTATTDANGSFSFLGATPGNYHLSADSLPGLLGGVSFGNINAPHGVDVVLNGGQVASQNVNFGGIAPQGISLREFLTSTTSTDFPFPAAGSGISQVNSRENSSPIVAAAIPNVTGSKGGSETIDLSGFFSDPDISNTMVRFDTSAGAINVELFDKQAPRTVANFLNYIRNGRYANGIFHRLVSGFVLQGGGFQFASNLANPLSPVATDPPVQNEFGISNTQGTLAMAKVGGDPNSATSQFFFNLADNSANLDSQNGGFTVFGKIVGPSDQQVLDTLASAPIRDESKGDPNSPFGSIPLINYTGTNFPTDTTASNYDLIQDAVIVSQPESLTYSVVGNTNPGLVGTLVTNERLGLTFVKGATGSSVITVQATDQFGATVTSSFTVSVADAAPTASVSLNTSAPQTDDKLTATATASDPDGDPVTLTYVWKVNGNVVQTTTTTATTDTLDLSLAGNGNKGDQITVSVTPNDGTLNGTSVSATATVANSIPIMDTVSISPNNPTTSTTSLTATPTAHDPDGDAITFSYQWKKNNAVLSGATSSMLDLSTVGTLVSGDVFTVVVTPSDGTDVGTSLNQSVTIS
jgi:cyclophilin family peptidyl-prolyl cis-trans isomerase